MMHAYQCSIVHACTVLLASCIIKFIFVHIYILHVCTLVFIHLTTAAYYLAVSCSICVLQHLIM